MYIFQFNRKEKGVSSKTNFVSNKLSRKEINRYRLARLCSLSVTQHPSVHKFIQLLSDGEITSQQFKTRLAQDCLFVFHYNRFAIHALTRAPQQDYKFLINALSPLADEPTLVTEINPNEQVIFQLC